MKTLKEFNCPRNLYKLAKSYFSERTANMTINSVQMEREVNKGCPQCSCCGPGLWNVQYNSLPNLEFLKRTKIIGFADDLIIQVRAETEQEAENYANREIRGLFIK